MNHKQRHRVGIVLSGGGTRGIAHIGALRALGEAGISPDCIAGASAGAVVGALYAAGYSSEQMLEFFVDKNPFRLSRMAITKPGIIDTAKVVADFREYFPDDSFEALDKELHVVATDLTRGKLVHFRSGSLIQAVLASASLPLMFTPMEVDEQIYADGGIVNNFPVELLAGSCDVLIGVHVGRIGAIDRSQLSNSLSVLRRAMEVAAFRQSEAKFDRCDVVILPKNLDRFGIFDTKHFEDVEAAGYEETRESMVAIREALDRTAPR